jgi:hypothetical protein
MTSNGHISIVRLIVKDEELKQLLSSDFRLEKLIHFCCYDLFLRNIGYLWDHRPIIEYLLDCWQFLCYSCFVVLVAKIVNFIEKTVNPAEQKTGFS